MLIVKKYIDYINEGRKAKEGFWVGNINKSDIPKLLRLKYEFFAASYNYNKRSHNKYNKSHTDWELSKKLMDGNKIIGGYFIRKSTVESQFLNTKNEDITKRVYMKDLRNSKWINKNVLYDIRPLYNKNGVQGVSLFIDKEYRNLRLGQLLIDSILNNPKIDYMYGYAYHTLNNIKSWMKRRYLISDIENFDEEENHDYGSYMTVDTKGIILQMTEFGKKYQKEHPDLNFK